MTLRALLGSLVLLSGVAQADDYEARVFAAEDGGKLPYRLLKPVNYDASQQYPLVVLLHGAGERGDDNKAQLKWGGSLFTKPENREKYPAFVLVPQCPKDRKWVEMDWGGEDGVAPADPGPTQKLLIATIDSLQKEFSIDIDRHYITGLSMGGYGTWDLITREPGRWAAAAPICGGGDKSKAGNAKAIPVWAFHGAADAVVKPVRSTLMVEALKKAGGTVSYTLYPGVAHDSWSFAFAEPTFLPWMFAQKRGQPAQKMDLAMSPLTVLAMPPENVFPGSGPLQLADWFKKLWMQRRVEFSKNAEKEKGAVVFLGDSITQGWATLASDFPNLKVANRGISGDTSRGVRYRLKEDVMSLQPRAVSLLIGTNDLALGGEPAQVIENIKAIIAELQKQNANVPLVLNRVMPRGPAPGKFPDKIRELNAGIDALVAADKRLTLCDTWTIFDDGKGSCKKEEFPDMLHPNKAGYAKWKEALAATFEKIQLK
jgi:lysophospholipase L1-like esterase/poly(3-hydroxybutyrate) depolymerase